MADHSIKISIDASEAGRGAAEFDRALDRIKSSARGVRDVEVGVNPERTLRGVSAIARSLRDLAGQAGSLFRRAIAPDLDPRRVQRGVAEARAALDGLARDASGTLSPLNLAVGSDTGNAQEELRRLARMMGDLRAAGRPVDMVVNADTSDAEAARQVLRALAEDATRLSGLRVGIDLNPDAVREGADRIMAALGMVRRATDGPAGTIDLRADTRGVRVELARVHSMLADLAQTGAADVAVSVRTDEAERDAARATGLLDTLRGALGRLSSSGARVAVGVDADDAATEIDRLSRSIAGVQAEADGLAARDISPRVDAAPALRELAGLRDAVAAMDARLELSPDLDPTAAFRELDRLDSALADLRARLDFSPGIDSAAARREITTLGDALAGIRSRIDVPVSVDAAAAMRQLRALASELLRLQARRARIEMPADAVEAGAEDMLAAFLQVRQAADAADGTEVRVGLDLDDLRLGITQLSSVLDDLRREGGVDIPLGVDTANVAEAADRAVGLLREIAGRTGNLDIPLDLDIEGIDEETRDLARQIRAEIERNLEGGVPVEASLDVVTGAALAEVDRFMAEASRPVEVPITADTTRADAEARALRNRLGSILGRNGPRVTIGGDASGAVDAARAATEALDGVSDAAGRVSDIRSFRFNFGDLVSGAKNAVGQLVNFQKEAKKLPQAASEAQVAWRQFFQEMETAEIAIEVIGATAVAVADAITSFEDMESALQAVTGTALKAGNAFGTIRDFARDTPFQIQDVTDAFVALKSQGLDANRDALTGYGNMASALNLTLKEMAEAVADAAGGDFDKLNETMVKGERQGAKVILTYRGMRTEVENSSRAIAQALQEMGNTTFAGGMEKAAEGVKSAFDRVKDAAIEFSNAIGSGGLSAGLENFSNALTDAMNTARPFAELLGGALGATLTDLAGNLRSTATELAALANVWNTVTGSVSGFIDAVREYTGLGPTRGPAPPAAPEDPVDAAIRQEGLDALDLNLGDPREKQAPFIREGVFLQKDDKGKFQTKSNGLSLTAPDDRDEKRVSQARSRGASQARSQAEAYRVQSTALKEQVDMLRLQDDAYSRGRTAVEQYRNSMEELSAKLSFNESVGKKNAQTLVDLTMDAKDLQETLAFKGAVLDMTENIGQVEALAAAFGQGTAAARDQEAANTAWNKAVELGRAGRQESVQQLYDLEKASQAANASLAAAQGLAQIDVEVGGLQAMIAAYQEGGDAIRQAAIEQETLNFALQAGLATDDPMVGVIRERITALRDLRAEQALAEELAGMDRETTSLSDMADAYREGGSAVRDATIAQEAYAMAVRLGVEHDDASRHAIEAKTRALYDMREANEEARRAMEVGFDLEQAERELGLMGMAGEAREIEAARIDLLMDKKRRLGDATATLTIQEEQLAVTMAQVSMAAKAQDSELMRLATSIPDMATAWDMAATGGLMHFEDALVDIVTGAKSAREAFADMARSIAADLARMAIRMAIIQPLAMMFGGGGMVAGNMAMMGGGMAMGSRHTGGVVGVDPAPMKLVTGLPPVASWTRLHAGGLAGNEVPTVLQRGEAVLTPGQMKMLAPVGAGGGGATNNITVNVQAQQGMAPADAERQGRIIAMQIEQAMNEKLGKELRNGGMLNPNGY